jgi:hypothetical protein
MRKTNFPAPGKVVEINDLQMGGTCYSLMKNGEGKLSIADLMYLGMTTESEVVTGKAGSIVVVPSKTTGIYPSIVSGLMIGPQVAMIPKMAVADEEVVVAEKKKKKKPAVKAVKELMMSIGSDKEARVISSKHITDQVMKLPVDFLVQEGATNELELLPEGRADLLKVLMCDGVEVSVMLAKSFIPKTTTRAMFVLVAKSREFNDGEAVHLLSSMPQAGTPKDILKPDLLGLEHGVNSLWDLPWGDDREVVTGMLLPMVKFANDLSNLITAQEFQKKSMLRQFPVELRKVVNQLQNLYAKRKGSDFSELLSCVKVRMAYEDGAATPSGLLLDEPHADEVEGGEEDEADAGHGRGKDGKKRFHPASGTEEEEDLDPEYEPSGNGKGGKGHRGGKGRRDGKGKKAKGKKAKGLAKVAKGGSPRSGSEYGSPSQLAGGSKRARPSPASSSEYGKSKRSAVPLDEFVDGLIGSDEDEEEELFHPGSGTEEEDDDDDDDSDRE